MVAAEATQVATTAPQETSLSQSETRRAGRALAGACTICKFRESLSRTEVAAPRSAAHIIQTSKRTRQELPSDATRLHVTVNEAGRTRTAHAHAVLLARVHRTRQQLRGVSHLLSHCAGIAYSTWGALWPVSAWSSRRSSGAGGTWRALGEGEPLNTERTQTGHRPPRPGPGHTYHLAHVPRLAFLSWRSRQTLRTGMVRS